MIDGYIKSYNIRLFCLRHQKPLIGVKGRLQTSKYEDEDKVIHYNMDIIAERVSFLSNKKTNE